MINITDVKNHLISPRNDSNESPIEMGQFYELLSYFVQVNCTNS